MAFLDDAEATTYRMLKQVLQNHCTTQTLCFPHTLVGCGALVALVCAQRDETRGALEPLVAHTLAELKQYTWARRSAPPLALFPAECLAHDSPAHLAQSEAVFQALAQFLHDSLAAERVTLAGAVRIVLSLLADLFAMLTHQYGHTAEEVEAWERKDPLTRFTAYLEKRNLMMAGVEADVDAEIAAAVARFEAAAPPDPLTMFDHAYGAPPLHVEAQRAEVAARLRADAPAPAAGGAEPPAPVPMRGQRTTRR